MSRERLVSSLRSMFAPPRVAHFAHVVLAQTVFLACFILSACQPVKDAPDATPDAQSGSMDAARDDADAAASAPDALPPIELDASDDAQRPSSNDAGQVDAARAEAGLDAAPVDAGPDSRDDASASEGGTSDAAPVVATTRIEIPTNDGGMLPLQLWYPALESARAEAELGHPVAEFEPAGPRRALIERLLQQAPPGCASQRMHAALDAPVREATEPFPLLVYSHHLEGMRFALFSLAESLVKRGFVVAAPDHAGRTIYDRTDDLMTADPVGIALRFGLDDLRVRAAQIRRSLDVLLDPTAQLPAGLRGKLDANRVALLGHSLGSATMGVVATADTRVKAAAYLAYPPALTGDIDLLGQPMIQAFRVPALFMLAQEDGSVGAQANASIRQQYEAHAERAYLVELRDAGHWSITDDCALIPDFADGCGQGKRIEPPNASFTFLANAEARASAARYVGDFLQHELLAGPLAALAGASTAAHELVRSHEATPK